MGKDIAMSPDGTVSLKTQLKVKILAMMAVNALYYKKSYFIYMLTEKLILPICFFIWLGCSMGFSDYDSPIQQTLFLIVFIICSFKISYDGITFLINKKNFSVERHKQLQEKLRKAIKIIDVENEETNTLQELNNWINIVVSDTETIIPYNQALLLLCLEELACPIDYVTTNYTTFSDNGLHGAFNVLRISYINKVYFYIVAFFNLFRKA